MSFCVETERQQFFKKVDNCYWNPKLKIKVLPSGDRTVVASAQIKNEEPLVVLNKGICFGNDQAIEHSVEDLNDINKNLVIAAYLYQFYTGHTDSFPNGYDHYFNSLPTYDWYRNNHELIKFYLSLDEKQKDKLKEDSFLIGQLDRLVKWINEIPGHEPNIEQAIRCLLITITRCWSTFGLVPWIDFFNHSYQGSILSNQGTSIHATHTYEEGDEVNTSYGIKDSFQLLTVYGYATKETTISLVRPPVSKLAIALDSELNNRLAFSDEFPLLVKKGIGNFNYIISYFRLCAFNKYDLNFVDDILTEHRSFINAENERKAIKIAFFYMEKTRKHLTEIRNNFHGVSEDLPKCFVYEFKTKMEILDELRQRFQAHWLELLDKNN